VPRLFNCPHCSNQLDGEGVPPGASVNCPFCNQHFKLLAPHPALPSVAPPPLPSSLRAPQPAWPAQQSPVLPTYEVAHSPARRVYIPDKKSAGLAAILSFFYIGLGQVYNGQIAKGLLMMFLPPIVAVVIFLSYLGFGITSISLQEGPEPPTAVIKGKTYFIDEIPDDLLRQLKPADQKVIEDEVLSYQKEKLLQQQRSAGLFVIGSFTLSMLLAAALAAVWVFGIFDAYNNAERINKVHRPRFAE
jgi:hypothetical protein